VSQSNQPFELKVYDPDRIQILFGSFRISRGAGASGYANGDFAKLVQPTASFIEVVGTDGSVTRSKTYARLTEFTLLTMQSNSLTNGFLSAQLFADEVGINGAGILPLSLVDLNGTTIFQALRAWVTKPPDQDFSNEAKPREWVLKALRDTLVAGGN
jgi:hypothetical protein